MYVKANKQRINKRKKVCFSTKRASFWIKDSFERSEPAFMAWLAFKKSVKYIATSL